MSLEIKSQNHVMSADNVTSDGKVDDSFVFVDEDEDAYYERMKDIHELYRKLDILNTQEAMQLLSDEINGEVLKNATDEQKSNREFVLAAVSQFGGSLQYVRDEFKLDREIVLAAICEDIESFIYVSPEFYTDQEFMADVAQKVEDSYYLSNELIELIDSIAIDSNRTS